MALVRIVLALLPASVASSSLRTWVNLSNVALPVDQHGARLLTGEASVLAHEGVYYFYFNNWGSCPGVDCCASVGGCASCCFDNPPSPMEKCSDPYGENHVVQAYATSDFTAWQNLGVALPLSARHAGIEFRPSVVFNEKTNLFVMWYEDRGIGETGYAVAVSKTPGGPFRTTHTNVTMPGSGKIGDFNIFVDDDGVAYHVRTGFDIVRLNANFTGPTTLVASFQTPKRSEGPTMFKRNGYYYVTAGTVCCACVGGASIYVLASPNIAGPYHYLGDVGSVPGHVYDPHSPENYVTKAQGSAIFKVGENIVWLGNQWNSGLKETPPGPRNHDLLYWARFEFEEERDFNRSDSHPPTIKQLEYTRETVFQLPHSKLN